MRRLIRRTVPALVGLTALVATACSSEPAATPEQELAAALEDLVEGDFEWDLDIGVSSEMFATLGQEVEALGAASQFASGIRIGGRQSGGATALTVGFGGGTIVEVRSFGEGRTFVQLGVQGLLGLMGLDGDALLSDMQAQGLAPRLVEIAGAGLGGEWLAFDVDPEELAETLGGTGGGDAQDAQAAMDAVMELVGDPAELVERIADVTVEDGEGGKVYSVVIDTERAGEFIVTDLAPALADSLGGDAQADLADVREAVDQMLAQAPATVPGIRITVVDDEVASVTIDLDEMLGALGADVPPNDDSALVFEFEHDGVGAVDEPTAAVTITNEDLELLANLAQMAG